MQIGFKVKYVYSTLLLISPPQWKLVTSVGIDGKTTLHVSLNFTEPIQSARSFKIDSKPWVVLGKFRPKARVDSVPLRNESHQVLLVTSAIFLDIC